jgi:hypothetical protein
MLDRQRILGLLQPAGNTVCPPSPSPQLPLYCLPLHLPLVRSKASLFHMIDVFYGRHEGYGIPSPGESAASAAPAQRLTVNVLTPGNVYVRTCYVCAGRRPPSAELLYLLNGFAVT